MLTGGGVVGDEELDPGGVGRGRIVEDEFVENELPRFDSDGEKGDEGEAERTVLIDPCRKDLNDGGKLSTEVAMEELGEEESSFDPEENREGKERGE